MRRLIGLLTGLLMLAACSPAMAQDDTHKLQQQVQSLTATVQELQAEVKELKASQARMEQAQQANAQAPVPPPPPVAAPAASPPAASSSSQQSTLELAQVERSPLPERQNVSGNAEAASRIDNEAPPTNPELKGFFLIPGTQTLIRLGGYAKLDMMYDTGSIGNQDEFATSSIPVPEPHDNSGNFNMQARQTRFTLEVRRPTIFGETMRFYFENDFFGGASGQYQFHLRQAYGQLGNTYAGYGFTAFEDADAYPETLDFEGPGGAVSAYQPAIHQSFHLGAGNSLTVSLEKPTSDISSNQPASENPVHGTQHMPDLVLAGRTEHAWGHMQLGVVLRQLGYTNYEHDDRVLGKGASLSGVFKTGGSSHYGDLLTFGTVWGKGIAHYLNDTGGLGLDGVVGPDGRLHPLTGWGAYGGYTHYWNNDWRSNLVYGVARLQDSPWLATTAFHQSNYGAANLIWNPVPTLTVGVELLHGRLLEQDNRYNDDTRIQGSLQYSFIK
jgi:hypothetical protein